MVGGSGRSSSINFDDLMSVIKKLNALNDNFQIIYCFSRRTTTKLKNFIINNANKNCFFFQLKFLILTGVYLKLAILYLLPEIQLV